jgi:hypothetical protein
MLIRRPALRLQHATKSGRVQRDRREIGAYFASLPPNAAHFPLLGRNEVIFEQSRPDVTRRAVGKGVGPDQTEHISIALQKFGDQIHEPWILFVAAHGGKPHEPI